MGLELKNPLIVGANNQCTKLSFLREAQEAGVAAIVYKSLFEEQILLEEWRLTEDLEAYAERNAEMVSLFPRITHAGPEEFLLGLKQARECLSIPLIASLNCNYDDSWPEYAKMLEKTGVDGIELNFYASPKSFETTAKEIEDAQVELLKNIRANLNIPVAVKLSPYYTNTLNFVRRLDDAGADAFVLFNRMFQPEIDIETETNTFPWNMSGKRDSRLALRYAGLLYGQIRAQISASNGMLDSNTAIQMLLAGADTIQVVSAIFQNKVGYIATMLGEIQEWMDAKEYSMLNDFRGKLSKLHSNDPFAYRRAQYVDMLINSKKALEKYDLI
jgi:dihydroorotate dehydrogenase (fumarate)